MSETRLPDGWTEDKIKGVLGHYEEQSEGDALLEDEAAVRPAETVMTVPRDLVPVVRELIAKRRR